MKILLEHFADEPLKRPIGYMQWGQKVVTGAFDRWASWPIDQIQRKTKGSMAKLRKGRESNEEKRGKGKQRGTKEIK